MPTRADDPFADVLPKVHEGVRKSALMCALHDRLAALPPGAFPFAGEFGRLRDLIAPQIGDTRILFPEFTPHDEELHVVALFQLADRLFRRVYPNLKAVELFLLGCALYAHDWGMAVGSKERVWLQRGARPEDLDQSFAPLPDETERLRAFARAEGLRSAAGFDFPEFSDQRLRLYVRQTHARRSGARVRAHFHTHPALGEALAHLCEGHWHDFATLDDPQRFPRDYEVVGDTAHLLALSLQVRLIDLFHLTDDRTPYALWRFVSPTDQRSAEEWRKHRALHGLACMDFPPGRAIKVQGFTENEEVWAGLQDLRRYCEDQVARTLDLSARHVPERYGLDFLKLEWAVTTGTLRPVDFAFGFDRAAMFRILSDDIYDGERHVFLRELLQNAIDAIRTRRSCGERRSQQQAKRRKATPPFDTTIYFTAEHRASGDILVTCRDYGIGMDEHIIRNYFSVAGVSYYRSTEFERQGLGFEPVSRFGIGILSCFMVADALDVRTYRDPDHGPAMAQADLQLPGADAHRARRLHLSIPAVDRQFIVKDGADGFDVGTEVSLLVLNRKAKATAEPDAGCCEQDEPGCEGELASFPRTLEITEYLCEIAGFVEFPIHVEERWPGQETPRLTLILHPDRDPKQELDGFDPTTVAHQLSRDYPWEAVTAPESIETARELMAGHRFELKELLGNEGYEGWVSFPAPNDGDFCFGGSYSCGDHTASSTLISRKRDDVWDQQRVFWKPPERGIRQAAGSIFGVYRDGLLLKGIRWAERLLVERNYPYHYREQVLPLPRVAINLPNSGSARPNVSRTALIAPDSVWDIPIWGAIRDRLAKTEVPRALTMSPAQRLFRLGWLKGVFPLSMLELKAMVPTEKRVRVWLVPRGHLEFREGPYGQELAPEIPDQFTPLIVKLAGKQFRNADSESNILWQGPSSVLLNTVEHHFGSAGVSVAHGLECAASWTPLIPERLQFLQPPAGHASLIRQVVGRIDETLEVEGEDFYFIYRRRGRSDLDEKRKRRIRTCLETVVTDPKRLKGSEIRDVFYAINPKSIAYAAPFECYFGATDQNGELQLVNLLHHLGQTVFRCLAACTLAIIDQRLSPSLVVEYQDLKDVADFQEFVAALFSFVEKHALIKGFLPPPISDDLRDIPALPDGHFDYWSADLEEWESASPFGRVITEWPLPTQGDGNATPGENGAADRGTDA